MKKFTSQELPLLIEQEYLTEFCKVDLTENGKVSRNNNKYDRNDKNINSLRAPVHENSATSNLHAPWSGFNLLPSRTKMTRGNDDNPEADWSRQFHDFLLQRMNEKTAGDRLRYAKQFAVAVLVTGDAQSLLQLKPDKRIHAMKAIASLSRFLGCYDAWMQIRYHYNLKWSTGNEALATFERFFDDKKTMDTMLQWAREAIQALPPPMAQCIKFNCLTGLRPNESLRAIRLIRDPESLKTYYNPENQSLEHFRFPQLFLRRTKSSYISLIEPKQLSAIAKMQGKTLTYEVLRFRLERAGVQCHLGYCRKIVVIIIIINYAILFI